jgi:cytoskeleton protein RodZ
VDIGGALKNARTERKLSLNEVEEATKIRLKYLQAMEENNFSQLPPGMYGAAFLRTYARFLALDADQLVAAYRESTGLHQPAADDDAPYTEVRSFRPRKGVWGAAAALVILAAALGIFGHRFGPGPGSSAPPPGPSPAAQTKPVPAAPSQMAAASGLNLVLQATNDYSWVRVTVDGAVSYEGFLYAGQQKAFQGTHDIDVRLGNAGSVRVLLNGQDYGYLGGTGEVVDRSFTAGG